MPLSQSALSNVDMGSSRLLFASCCAATLHHIDARIAVHRDWCKWMFEVSVIAHS